MTCLEDFVMDKFRYLVFIFILSLLVTGCSGKDTGGSGSAYEESETEAYSIQSDAMTVQSTGAEGDAEMMPMEEINAGEAAAEDNDSTADAIEEDQAEEEEERKVVKRKTFPVRPMSVEDATIEMELLGHSFFAFVNIDTDRTNVLYLRKDGDLGLLEPEA
jgi:hypothetical protein